MLAGVRHTHFLVVVLLGTGPAQVGGNRVALGHHLLNVEGLVRKVLSAAVGEGRRVLSARIVHHFPGRVVIDKNRALIARDIAEPRRPTPCCLLVWCSGTPRWASRPAPKRP